jgi:hypothetical protein
VGEFPECDGDAVNVGHPGQRLIPLASLILDQEALRGTPGCGKRPVQAAISHMPDLTSELLVGRKQEQFRNGAGRVFDKHIADNRDVPVVRRGSVDQGLNPVVGAAEQQKARSQYRCDAHCAAVIMRLLGRILNHEIVGSVDFLMHRERSSLGDGRGRSGG